LFTPESPIYHDRKNPATSLDQVINTDMRFRIWLEDEMTTNAMTAAPASSEVIKTGLQPQVDAKEIKTKQKEEHDLLLAIDGHIQRIKSAIDGISKDKGDKAMKVKKYCQKFIDGWEDVKSGSDEQQDIEGFGGPNPNQVQFMKQNQPLPEMPRASGPGTFGNM
jgi:hypothetical protein